MLRVAIPLNPLAAGVLTLVAVLCLTLLRDRNLMAAALAAIPVIALLPGWLSLLHAVRSEGLPSARRDLWCAYVLLIVSGLLLAGVFSRLAGGNAAEIVLIHAVIVAVGALLLCRDGVEAVVWIASSAIWILAVRYRMLSLPEWENVAFVRFIAVVGAAVVLFPCWTSIKQRRWKSTASSVAMALMPFLALWLATSAPVAGVSRMAQPQLWGEWLSLGALWVLPALCLHHFLEDGVGASGRLPWQPWVDRWCTHFRLSDWQRTADIALFTERSRHARTTADVARRTDEPSRRQRPDPGYARLLRQSLGREFTVEFNLVRVLATVIVVSWLQVLFLQEWVYYPLLLTAPPLMILIWRETLTFFRRVGEAQSQGPSAFSEVSLLPGWQDAGGVAALMPKVIVGAVVARAMVMLCQLSVLVAPLSFLFGWQVSAKVLIGWAGMVSMQFCLASASLAVRHGGGPTPLLQSLAMFACGLLAVRTYAVSTDPGWWVLWLLLPAVIGVWLLYRNRA